MNSTIDSMFDSKPYAKLWADRPVGPRWSVILWPLVVIAFTLALVGIGRAWMERR